MFSSGVEIPDIVEQIRVTSILKESAYMLRNIFRIYCIELYLKFIIQMYYCIINFVINMILKLSNGEK